MPQTRMNEGTGEGREEEGEGGREGRDEEGEGGGVVY